MNLMRCAAVAGVLGESLDCSYALRQSVFERGAAERQTLPTFTTSDLVSSLQLIRQRDMKYSW